jgi:hypothetical protein
MPTGAERSRFMRTRCDELGAENLYSGITIVLRFFDASGIDLEGWISWRVGEQARQNPTR